ncbi:MAG: phosphatase PAP2 family protein [Actinomycetota bacterium]|nr:phosphatase PAP2 family protein [Actinomycetota bacterium]
MLVNDVIVASARGLSHVGEHALGWLLLGLLGFVASTGQQRRDWARSAGSVLAAHACAVLIKRLVRRRRPDDPRIRVLVSTPSRLSFPSAHVASTTAAAVAYLPLVPSERWTVTGVAAGMAVSRVVLGVHFPSDVAAGAFLGWAVAVSLRRYPT